MKIFWDVIYVYLFDFYKVVDPLLHVYGIYHMCTSVDPSQHVHL